MDQWQGVLPKGHSRHVSIYKTMYQRSFVSGDGLGVMYTYTIVQAIIYIYICTRFGLFVRTRDMGHEAKRPHFTHMLFASSHIYCNKYKM